MFKRLCVAAFAAAALLGGLQAAHADDPAKRMAAKYERFAGSEKNALALVEGLRNDTEVELSANGKSARFTPRTGKMGWGNVDHALALAKASLAERGIHNPTPEQIKAALNGSGGVLALRASGMGWGEIAHKLGFKLGDVKRADFHRAKDGHRPAKVERPEKFERPQRPERPERHHSR